MIEAILKILSPRRGKSGIISLFIFTQCFFYSFLARAEFVMTLGGDMNLARNQERALPQQICGAESCMSFREVFKDLKPLLVGELNFFSLDSIIVGDDFSPPKTLGRSAFQSHWEALRYLQSIGLNWASLANDHVGVFGSEGLKETLKHLENLNQPTQPFYYHGIASRRKDLFKPAVIQIESHSEGTVRIAFAAVTFENKNQYSFDPMKPGFLYPQDAGEMEQVLAELSETSADFKVLSIHDSPSQEGIVDSSLSRRYRSYIEKGKLDLIIGHHPQRVLPVEQIGTGMIFYSLGQYLHFEDNSSGSKSTGGSSGMMARLYLRRDATGHFSIQSADLIPLAQKSNQLRAVEGSEARLRVERLSAISVKDLGVTGVHWNLLPTGWGFYCLRDCSHNMMDSFFK